MQLIETIKKNLPKIENIRKELSENAELSFKEFKTQKIIMDFFQELNMETSICANTGVLAVLNKSNQCIAIRADMDALPVNGISHACGHDYHMAIVLGTALVLKELGYNNCIKFIFQPGEEGTGGALPMINEGALKSPDVTKIIGFHVWPKVTVGTIEITEGPSMASVDDFYIKFIGTGGHAAIPKEFNNPLFPAMEFAQTINTSSDNGLITVSCLNCGSKGNVVSNEAILLGTIRTFDSNLRKEFNAKILQVSKDLCKKYNCKVETNIDIQYPALVSNKKLTDEFISKTNAILGEKNIIKAEKTFAAEDFSFFAEKVPAVHFRLGIMEGEKGISPLHSPIFNASEKSLFYGVYILTNYILNTKNC